MTQYTTDFTKLSTPFDNDNNDTTDMILDDPNDKYLSVNAKLTTNAGISVSYVAPALPSSSQDSDTGWDTIEEDDDEEGYDYILDDPNDKYESYKSFLRPYGQVLLDPDLDFEPQVMIQDNPDDILDDADFILDDSYASLDDANAILDDPNGINYDPNEIFDDTNAIIDDPNTIVNYKNDKIDDPEFILDDTNAILDNPNAILDDPNAIFYDSNTITDYKNDLFDDTNTYLYDPNTILNDPNDILDDPNAILDDHPPSWEDEDDQNDGLVAKVVKTIANGHDILDEPNAAIKDDPNAYPWSDIGQSVNSSFEFWKVKNKLKAKPKTKLFETKYQHNNKYASDSNINDAVDMTEPGLRKIPKEAIYSTTDQETSSPQGLEEDSEHVYYSINDIPIDHPNAIQDDANEDNIYESVDMQDQNNPESGFFSMDHGKAKSKKITCIPVNQRPSSSSSDDYVSCHVTVNGKLWINPLSNILDDDPNDILDDPNDILGDPNDILDDPNAYFVQTTNSAPVLTNGGHEKLLLSIFIFLFSPTN